MNSPSRRPAGIFEFLLVLTLGFGWQIWQSASIAYREYVLHRTFQRPALTNAALLSLAGIELAALALISIVGYARGWSFKSFGWRVSWSLTGIGLALFAVGCLTFFLVPLGIQFSGRVSLWALVPVLAINAFYEETLEIGYIFRAFDRWGMWAAVLASAILRAWIHLYAGLPAVLAIFAAGILTGLIYWRWKSLWPLFLAHLLDDLLVLSSHIKA